MTTTRLEYGIARNSDDWVIKTRNLTDAIQQAKEAGNDWHIMERAVSDWTEVE